MPVVNLTSKFIERQLTCPQGQRRIEYVHNDRSGLYIEVRATAPGHGTWYLRYKDANGKTCHQRIGRTHEMSLEQAKARARQLKAEIALGANPREEEKQRKAVLTLKEFFDEHYLAFAKERKRSWTDDQGLWERRLRAAFGDKRLNQITRQEIQQFHTGLKAEGLAAASCNHYIKLLRRMLNLAVEWELLDRNPAARVALFRENNQLDHSMNDEELKRLLSVLRSHRNRSVATIALFLLSTGARLNEALKAQWSHVDLERRVWQIPAYNSKSGKVRSVPLNDSALDVLRGLNTSEGYLFVNRKTGQPYTTIHKGWEQIREAAGLPHLRLHDLRHQFASFLVNSGRSLYEVQAVLGHSDPTVTQRYSHLSTKALQEAADSASAAIGRAS
jgi:integrase